MLAIKYPLPPLFSYQGEKGLASEFSVSSGNKGVSGVWHRVFLGLPDIAGISGATDAAFARQVSIAGSANSGESLRLRPGVCGRP